VSTPSSIAQLIEAEGGLVTFARFMELALTHPVLGYYSRADRLLRYGGDFSTAPALSPFFNRTLARLVTELMDAALTAATEQDSGGGSGGGASARGAGRAGGRGDGDVRFSVVELGGGEGQLAEAVLRYWTDEHPDLKHVAYRIVEVGEGLRQRQAEAVQAFSRAGWDVGWAADLTRASTGTRPLVVVGNEFLDTIPVHSVEVGDTGLREAYVRASGAGLEQSWGELSPAAAAEIELLFGTLDPQTLRESTEDGFLEVFPGLGDLMGQVAEVMPSGSLVTVDYGEWFPGVVPGMSGGALSGMAAGVSPCVCSPDPGGRWGLEGRTGRGRTARGYFKHQLVPDPLVRAGRQDLTADVDFAAADLHGQLEGFETVLFTSLSQFLRAGGAEDALRVLRSEGLAVEAGSPGMIEPTPGDSPGSVFADPLEADRQATVLENLLDERDLGGAFKLMVQVRE
jgi:SAM-dependent MidA family methyltransferase